MKVKLVVGNKNYSTWSLRPWLLLKAFNVHFEEVNVSLAQEGLRDRLLEHSPTAKVPVLIEREQHIWDSLAICEYVNDVHLDGTGWPHTAKDRALARSVTCEMHSGFFAVRGAMPMNIRARRKVDITPDMAKDIARIEEIWANHHRSGWLFETFGIADCFYAPVAFRFATYGVELNEAASQYMHKLLAHPALKTWVDAALLETEILPVDEAGEDV
jgi:glutathione S-transferase